MMQGLRRPWMLLAMLVGIVGIVINFVLVIPAEMTATELRPEGRSLIGALLYFWTYFTHLTNLGLILVYLGELSGWGWLGWFRKPSTQTAFAGFITLVMIFYHFMLAPFYPLQGGYLLASTLLHYVAPLAFLGFWLLYMRHGELRWRDLPFMLIPGAFYLAWVLLRGAFASEYPYDILDAGKNGYGGVAIGVGVIMVAVSIFCALLIWLDGRLGRRAAA